MANGKEVVGSVLIYFVTLFLTQTTLIMGQSGTTNSELSKCQCLCS